MIRGTNADCRVLRVSVSETTAMVSLLIFATVATSPSKPFRFWIKDAGTGERKLANAYTYWVDRTNNYDGDANNVDLNRYKEVILSVDITDSGKADIQNGKWTREVIIQLCDVGKAIDDVAWASDRLTLVSDEFEIPTVAAVSFKPVDAGNGSCRIRTSFRLSFRTQADFNYSNSNFLARVNVRSLSTDAVLETKLVANSTSTENEVVTDEAYDYGESVVVELLIMDSKENVYYSVRKIYKPRRRYSMDAWMKTADGIRKVSAFYVQADPESQHEGEWLPMAEEVSE